MKILQSYVTLYILIFFFTFSTPQKGARYSSRTATRNDSQAFSDGFYEIPNSVPRFKQIFTLKLKTRMSFLFLIPFNEGFEPTLGLYNCGLLEYQ